MHPRSRVAFGSTLLAAALLVPSAHALAGPTPPPQAWITAKLSATDCELSGQTDVNRRLTITHTASSGVKKAVYKVQGDSGTGAWFTGCTDNGLVSGDRLIVRTRPGAELIRTVTVPVLSMTINRASDTVTGQAKGDPGLLWIDCNVWTCPDSWGMGLSPDPSGRYTKVSERPLDGLDLLTLSTDLDDDEWKLDQWAPKLDLTRGKAIVSGFARRPGAKVTVTVTRGATVATFTGTAGPDASFRGTVKRNGAKFPITAGDVVTASIASDVNVVVPAGALTVDGSGISGTCFANQEVKIAYVSPDTGNSTTTHATANGTGAFTLAVTPPSGWNVSATCQTAQGDTVLMRTVAP